MDVKPEDSLGFQVRRCHRAFERVLTEHLAEHKVSAGFWGFLRALWQENGATQKRLSQLNNVTEPTAVTTLNGMTKAGLIRRQRNAEDRRKQNVHLTPEGERLKAELLPIAGRINTLAAEGIDPEELRITLSVLRRMSENLSRDTSEETA
ncbi:MarR family transcriptional regulator [Phenylobacterium sp. J426]|uniref:MarR family winged helix-turn-helix transcriptional regulator n=2 Tax=Phenylobacterium sp. J426 TaxID=2898439 RepID=UPI002151D78B|nr:MarR family transcriptional regulator [Phenylobacterium sp. J426]MCR5876466.1 MarR family transcriptional regulator [Phenylobacterium sp. J426]